MKPLHQFQNIYNPYSNNVDNKQPSLYQEPDITNSVGPVSKEFANIEAEKDEVILKPDLSGMYKIKGKKHSSGGTKIPAEVGSFIFSDYKKLALSKDQQEVLKLKEGGPVGKQENTPSEVLRRNIDIEHYNRMVNNLSDLNKDNIAKKTSELMLNKYRDILGRIAYAQEKKKEFKSGLPPFVDNTAPAIDLQMKDKIDEQEQYLKGGAYLPKARYGKYFNPKFPIGDDDPMNPYLTPEQQPPVVSPVAMANRNATNPVGNWGLHPGDILPDFEKLYGLSNKADKISNLDKLAQELRYPGQKDNKQFQQWLYNSSPENKAVIDKWHNNYNVGPHGGMMDGKIGIRWQNAINDILKPKPQKPRMTVTNPGTEPWKDPDIIPQPIGPNKNILPYDPNVQKTLPMIADEVWAGIQAAGVKRYDPYRAQIKSQLTQFNGYNSQNALNNITSVTNRAYNATRGMNPYQAQATISEVAGKSLESAAQVQGQYDERNVGVQNQQNASNAQIQNQDAMTNIGFDQKYYDQSVASRQNFDDAKSAAWNNFVDVRNRHQEELDSLYNVLAQQPIAGSRPIMDKNGQQKLDAQGRPMYQSMPLYDVKPGTIRTYNTGVGNILNVPTGDRGDVQAELTNDIMKNWNSYSPEELKNKIAFLKTLVAKGYLPTTTKKMGGFVTKNPYL